MVPRCTKLAAAEREAGWEGFMLSLTPGAFAEPSTGSVIRQAGLSAMLLKDFGCSLSVSVRYKVWSSFAAQAHLSIIAARISVPTGNVMHPVCLLQVQPPHQPELCYPALQPG